MIDEVKTATAKVGLGIIGAVISKITLSQIAAVVTITYGILQIIQLIRNWNKERKN